ncbi:hypothetical protein [Umezawaea sp. Da 62-37]|uniref:hypothetical protein n=1 Tax=Umezawaea sp. Da 62-37 TaxID=3075927 RepID=UPI0028F731F1|nr:hypothetical protein [Umezawaea sp. Da 62-37]WNV87629.1 hypothetical protein RM788_04815 [Umezawaea sp. Da 62-37]
MGTIVAKLRNLADEPAYHGSTADLRRLADDLESGNSAPWRKRELRAFFDIDSVVGDDRTGVARVARHMDLVRNLLLFLPLLFTWGGIFLAVRAYRSLLNAPLAEQAQFADASFLQMWTRGFGGRTWATFDVVAMVDFLAILAIIVFFVVGTVLQRRASTAEEADRVRKVDVLRSALAEAAHEVGSDGDVVDRLTASVETLLPAYQETLDRMVSSQREMNRLVSSGQANIADLVRATGDLAVTGTAIAASAKDLESPAAALVSHVRAMETTTGSFASTVAAITTDLPSTRAGLLAVVTSVGELNRELRDMYTGRIEDLRKESAAYSVAVGELTAARQDLADSIDRGRHNVDAFVSATETLGVGASAVVTSSDDLKFTVAALAATTERFGGTVESLVSGTRDLASGLPAAQAGVLEVLAAIGDLGRKMEDIYARQEVVAQELGVLADNPLATAQAAKRTAEVARDAEKALAATVSALPEQMDRMRAAILTALDLELEERRAAAASVGDSFGTFSGAAVDAARSLKQAVDELRTFPGPLPDLRAAADELARSLEQSRLLVDELTHSVRDGGGAQGDPLSRRRWPWGRMAGDERQAG